MPHSIAVQFGNCWSFLHIPHRRTSYTFLRLNASTSVRDERNRSRIREAGNSQLERKSLAKESMNPDDVIKWKKFPRYWPFLRGIQRFHGEFPAKRPVTRRFDVLFDLCLNKQLSKQSWGWWFETLSRPLWRHRNDHAEIWGLLVHGESWKSGTNVDLNTVWV